MIKPVSRHASPAYAAQAYEKAAKLQPREDTMSRKSYTTLQRENAEMQSNNARLRKQLLQAEQNNKSLRKVINRMGPWQRLKLWLHDLWNLNALGL